MQDFLKSKNEVLSEAGVDEKVGLTDSDVLKSVEKYGKNVFSKKKADGLIKRFFLAFKEPMIIMLLAAGLIAVGVCVFEYVKTGKADFIETIGIFVAILLSVVITVVMEGRSAKAFEALNKFTEDTQVKVLRNGKVDYISQKDVAVGDILILSTGDKTPADGRLIESVDLRIDESSLTGESVPVKKNSETTIINENTPVAERVNMVYSGCFVTGGSGRVLVTGIGDNTEFGKIAKELSDTEKSQTPLQEKLAKLGKIIAIAGSVVALIVFLIQLTVFLSAGTANFETVTEAFITSIVLIVASVPEGLPTIVAVSLAINIIKMSKQNALVKKMVACETAGSVNVVCSDKTGTLTENKMTVMSVFQKGKNVEVKNLDDINLIKNFALNSTANVNFDEKGNRFVGNPTECALLVALNKCGNDYNEWRKKYKIVYSFPFSSENKNMTTVIKDGAITAFSKGSPEKIMDMCSMNSFAKEQLSSKMEEFEKKAYRILAFCHKTLEKEVNYEKHRAEIECDMIFDGFVAIADPIRKEVYKAVKDCKRAGIEIKMLTGDNIVTATAIAKELNIIGKDGIAVEAKELEPLSDTELKKLVPKIRVIARSTPIIKMRVVNALKSLGNVVAVTGDGINDAPALKNADIGIAMGITGTEVSKEASDIVLLDDSFSTIVKAIHWGRGIYENFQRFIQFQLTVNLSSVIVVLLSVLIGFQSPFTALQLLWINIVMDGPPALTLGLEPIRENLLDRKPNPRNSSIVNKKMLTNILVNGIFISIIFMFQSAFNFLAVSEAEESTVLFTMFVVFQLFNAFNSRELGNESLIKNFKSNRLMILVFVITFALQIIITQFGKAAFMTEPLSAITWLKIIGISFSVIVVSELVKLIQRFTDKSKVKNQI